jgi:glycosyltransferase involved in cell wall biosynthesis/O-antigen/teichoic acid export membrane protein
VAAALTTAGRRVTEYLGRRVGRGGMSFLLAAAAVNASNFVFHIASSRLLGPVTYGSLGALLNVIGVLAVPVSALQAAATQRIAPLLRTLPPDRGLNLRACVADATTLGLGGMGLFLLAAPLLASFLHTGSRPPIILVGLWLVPACLAAALQGALLAEGRFLAAAVSMGAGTVVGRLTVGVALMATGTGLTGAMIATVLGQSLTAGVLVYALRSELWRTQDLNPVRLAIREGLSSVGALSGIAALTGIDTFMARHYLPMRAAGNYAALANAGKVALFIPSAFAALIFPRFAAYGGQGIEARRALRMAVAAIALTGGAVALAVAALPRLMVGVLLGRQYGPDGATLGIIAFAAAGFGLVVLLSFYHLARRSRVALAPWAGVAVFAGLIQAWHGSQRAISAALLISTLATLALMILATVDGLLRDVAWEWEQDATWRQSVIGEPELDVTLVVPYFNPGPRFEDHLCGIDDILSASGQSYEIIAVSDGSSTHLPDDIERKLAGRLRLLRLPLNQGKGHALRVGMHSGRGLYLGFIDADGDIPASVLREFLTCAKRDRPDVLLGTKRHPRSSVEYPALRRLLSVGYQLVTRCLFRLSARDTQTGIKMVRRDVLAEVLPRMLEKRFAFDLELLVVARQLGYGHVQELPVTIGTRFTSTVSLVATWRLLIDTLAIFYRLRLMRFYGPRRCAAIAQSADPADESAITTGASTSAAEDRKTLDLRSGLPLSRCVNPKRILFLNWRDIKHPEAGGAEVYCHEVCRAWARQGHQVTVFTSAFDGGPGEEYLDGYRIIRRGGRFGVYVSAHRFYRRNDSLVFDLVIDAVNTRPFFAHRFGKDVPVVVLIHQVAREVWRYEFPLPVAYLGRYILEPFWLRRLRHIPAITVSDSSRESLAMYGLDNVYVVPEGSNEFSPQPERMHGREPIPTLIYVGRLVENKRPADAIRAFELARRRIPELQMWVVGTGPCEGQLRRGAPEGVHFLGRVPEEVRRDRLARAHALVVTSVREGWGLVVTDAAALGTPTIAYNVPGIRDSVAASGGFLTDPNPKSLADAVANLVPEWVGNAPPRVTPGGVVSWTEVADHILRVAGSAIFDSIADSSNPSRPYLESLVATSPP